MASPQLPALLLPLGAPARRVADVGVGAEAMQRLEKLDALEQLRNRRLAAIKKRRLPKLLSSRGGGEGPYFRATEDDPSDDEAVAMDVKYATRLAAEAEEQYLRELEGLHNEVLDNPGLREIILEQLLATDESGMTTDDTVCRAVIRFCAAQTGSCDKLSWIQACAALGLKTAEMAAFTNPFVLYRFEENVPNPKELFLMPRRPYTDRHKGLFIEACRAVSVFKEADRRREGGQIKYTGAPPMTYELTVLLRNQQFGLVRLLAKLFPRTMSTLYSVFESMLGDFLDWQPYTVIEDFGPGMRSLSASSFVQVVYDLFMQLNMNWSSSGLPQYRSYSSSERMQRLLSKKLSGRVDVNSVTWLEVFLRVDAALRLGLDVYGYTCRIAYILGGMRHWLYIAMATENDEPLQLFHNPIEAMEDRLSLVPDIFTPEPSVQFQEFQRPTQMYRRWWSATMEEHRAAKEADATLQFRLDAPRALFQRIIDRAKAASAAQIQQYNADRASGNRAC